MSNHLLSEELDAETREKVISKVVDFLNDLNEKDPSWMQALFSQRFQCNEQIALHPTVQVMELSRKDVENKYIGGFIGLLNGMFGVPDEFGPIGMNMSDEGKINNFGRFSTMKKEQPANE